MIPISFFNQKGGAGKSTSSTLCVDYLQTKYPQSKILAIDLDPQGSFSEIYLTENPQTTFLDFLLDQQPLNKCIYSINKRLDIIPFFADEVPHRDAFDVLDMKVTFQSIMDNYDYVVIDTRPSLDWIAQLGVYLSNYTFLPLLMARFDYEGLSKALKLVQKVSKQNPNYVCYKAFENRKKGTKAILKTGFRSLFEESLGEAMLEKSLPEVIAIEERTASVDKIFFRDFKNDRVEEFFTSLEAIWQKRK